MGINLITKYVQEFKITSGFTHPFMLYAFDRCLELIVCCVDICLTTSLVLENSTFVIEESRKGTNFKDIQTTSNI